MLNINDHPWIKELREDLYWPTSKLDFANQILRRFNRVLIVTIHNGDDVGKPNKFHFEKWSDYQERVKHLPTFNVIIDQDEMAS